jgi:polyisoprenoid-binding protein YceI
MGRTGKLVIVGVVVLLAALGGGYLLFANRTSGSPPPAALDAAPSTTTGQATGATQAQGDGAASPDGTWRVSGDGSSFVGYRVNEQLAFLNNPNQAVGRTTAVTGTMEVAGDTVEQVRIEADLTQLTSDEPRRDNAIRQRGLESERYPTATLELAEPIQGASPSTV